MFSKLCAPALIYIIFSLTQIILDIFKGFYNTALVKFLVMLLVTYLLNGLCRSGMTIISWIIVFVPFMLMSVIVGLLLFVFGLDPTLGRIAFPNKEIKKENKGGNLIFTNQPPM